MERQQQWHLLMRPMRSMLKFRLSWCKGITNYLDGDIYLPIWGPTATTESRLITHAQHGKMKNYDNIKYESQMFHFNTVTRVGRYKHPVGNDVHECHVIGDGLCHCYDCTAEVTVLMQYLQRFAVRWLPSRQDRRAQYTKRDFALQIAQLSRRLSKHCSWDRTLFDVNPEKVRHEQFITNFID